MDLRIIRIRLRVALFGVGLLGVSPIAWAHAHLISPSPRSPNDSIKTSPCGGLPRSASPTVVQANQPLAIQWTETINHPGKFLISLAYYNDLGFAQNVLLTLPDTQNGSNDTPHQFSSNVMMPNLNCDLCTLQLIQSMEENPASPSYYYSCADIKIVNGIAPAPTPPSSVPPSSPPNLPPDPNSPPSSSQSVPASSQATGGTAKFGGGCGLVKAQSKDIDPWSRGGALLGLLPFAAWFFLRRHSIKVLRSSG